MSDAWKRLAACRGEPLFRADWDRVLFLHFAVSPHLLQSLVPFRLDVREGKACVSLVAFTLRRMRLHGLGSLGALLCKPISTQSFLNVRTYVSHQGEPGIFFIREWLSDPLCVRLGPLTYGLPYHPARIDYDHQHEHGVIRGRVREGVHQFDYSARIRSAEFRVCDSGSLTEFLLERYTAFTARNGVMRYFRIWHTPWQQCEAEIQLGDFGLLHEFASWLTPATFVGAHYSPGARDVLMGRPHRVRVEARSVRRSRAFFEMP